MEALILTTLILLVLVLWLAIQLAKTQDERDHKVKVQYQRGWELGFQQGREAEKAERQARKQQIQLLKKQLEQLTKEVQNG